MALFLLQNREDIMAPLINDLTHVQTHIKNCTTCGNVDVNDPCAICEGPRRNPKILCIVESVADLWALERSSSFGGLYHILGGTLSALDGVGPEDLNIPQLLNRCVHVDEVILALNSTVDGQTTSHYLTEKLRQLGVPTITSLARGVPVGGELDYLDDGTLATALSSRLAI